MSFDSLVAPLFFILSMACLISSLSCCCSSPAAYASCSAFIRNSCLNLVTFLPSSISLSSSSWKFSVVMAKVLRTKSLGKKMGLCASAWFRLSYLGRFCAMSRSMPSGWQWSMFRSSCRKLICHVHCSGILGLPRPCELRLCTLSTSSSCSCGTLLPSSDTLSSE